jgi:hypothetical protein
VDTPVCPGSHFTIIHVELVIMLAAQHARPFKAAANLNALLKHFDIVSVKGKYMKWHVGVGMFGQHSSACDYNVDAP